jgi:hypothetical protein
MEHGEIGLLRRCLLRQVKRSPLVGVDEDLLLDGVRVHPPFAKLPTERVREELAVFVRDGLMRVDSNLLEPGVLCYFITEEGAEFCYQAGIK